MQKNYQPIEVLRAEMEHVLLPELFYGDEIFDTFEKAGIFFSESSVISDLYKSFCEEDGIEYPYSEGEFSVLYYVYKNISVFQIDFPEIETRCRKGHRAYMVFKISDNGKIKEKAYFLKETDVEKNTYLLYISGEGEKLATEIIGKSEKEQELLYKSYKAIEGFRGV